MADENLTTYTEVDPDNKITRTSSRLTFTGISESSSAYVYDDKGIDHFDEDFTHQFECYYDNEVGSTWASILYAVENFVGTHPDSIINGGDGFKFFKNGNEALFIYLQEDGVIAANDSTAVIADSTLYYITVVRDDDGGANSTGQYTVFIRTGSHEGVLVDTLTVDCSVGEQNDFRYLYVYQRLQPSGTDTQDGYVQNVNLNEAIPAQVLINVFKSALLGEVIIK